MKVHGLAAGEFFARCALRFVSEVPSNNIPVFTLLNQTSPNETPISRVSLGGASVVAFTVKDPSAFEKEAYVQAMDKSRPVADDIARRTKVQITGIESVTAAGQARVQEQFANPLDEVPYQYFSSSLEEVLIRVSLTVRYTYK